MGLLSVGEGETIFRLWRTVTERPLSWDSAAEEMAERRRGRRRELPERRVMDAEGYRVASSPGVGLG